MINKEIFCFPFLNEDWQKKYSIGYDDINQKRTTLSTLPEYMACIGYILIKFSNYFFFNKKI